MRPRQDFSRSRQKDYRVQQQSPYFNQQNNPLRKPINSVPNSLIPQSYPTYNNSNPYQQKQQPSSLNTHQSHLYQDKNDPRIPNIIQIYNIPQHHNKDDISYYIFKNLQLSKGLLRRSVNPISKSQYNKQKNCITLEFKTRQQALNCLELNGLYYKGNRSFFMKSLLLPRECPKIQTKDMKIRIVQNKVQDGFNKIFVGNLPQTLQEYEVIDILSNIGELKGLEPIHSNVSSTLAHQPTSPSTSKPTQYFVSFKNNQRIDQFLTKLNQLKIQNKPIIAKRAALMNTSQTSKIKTVVKSRRSMFQSDPNDFYLTLDIDGYFQDMKVSCVILLKNIITSQTSKQQILKDIHKQVQKIGPIVKLIDNKKNVYIEFQRVEYAQIAYLIITHRKYDGKSIDISFYDPISFADEVLN